MRQPPARENKADATGGITTSDKTTCPLQWTEHGTLRPCANFWCAASTYSMEQKPTRTCSKKTHTQRQGTLVVYTQVSSSSQFSQVITREMSHRAGSKRPGSQTVTKKPVSRRSTPLTFHRDFCVSTIGSQTTSNYSKEKNPQHCRGAVCTSDRAVARPQEPSHRLWRRPLLPLGRRLVTSCKRCRRFRTAAAIKLPVCNGKTNNTHHGTSEQRKRHATKKAPVSRPPRTSRMQATSRIDGLDNQPSSAVSATVLRGLRGSQSEPLPALLFLEHVDVLQVIPRPYDLAAARGKPQPRFGQKSTIRPSHSDNASLLSVSVSETSPFVPSTLVSRSPCRKFVSMVTVTMSCLTVS